MLTPDLQSSQRLSTLVNSLGRPGSTTMERRDPGDACQRPGAWPTCREQVDVYQRIANIFELLLKLLLPAPAPRRAAESAVLVRVCGDGPAPAPRPISPMAGEPALLSGEDCTLVRPYLVAHERRVRRQALSFALHGIDLDTRDTHDTLAVAR